MRGGRRASLVLAIMAALAFFGFLIYAEVSGDSEGIEAGLITGSMLLFLSWLSFIEIRPWRR
jgi:hypothetical protein